MLKKLACIFAFIIVTSFLHAEKLYEYRGVFPADRKTDANVTNYMLLNKASTVKFEIEEQDKGISDKLKVTRVVLTSDPQISFDDTNGVSRLELPETGIYEIRIEPENTGGGEIRFILRVMEDVDAADDIDLVQTRAVPVKASEEVNNTSSAADVMKKMEELHSLGNIQTVEDIDQPEPESVTQPKNLSEVITASQTAKIQTLELISDEGVGESVGLEADEHLRQPEREVFNADHVHLIAPQKDHFLSSLSGFTFSGLKIDQLSQQQLQEIISINCRTVDGSMVPVQGSFFSMEPDRMSFLIDKIEPGAVYHARVLPGEDLPPVNYSAFALPELNAGFERLGEMIGINISWPQIERLAPNPSGQLITLPNTKIVVYNGSEVLATIEGGLQPRGVLGEITYRARPYSIELTIPLASFDSFKSAAVAVEAIIDGNSEYVTVFKAQNTGHEQQKKTDEEIDFSMIPALEKQGDVTVEIAPQKVIAIEKLPESANFNLTQSFPVYQNAKDKIVAWPHEIVWGTAGNLWVLDSQRKMISCYAPSGQIVNDFGAASQQLLGVPTAIVHEMGSVFVSDSAKRAIFQFDELGNLIGTINSKSDKGQIFEVPGGITFRQSEMWLVERGADRILCFDNRGSFLGSFASTAEAPFRSPIALKSDKEGLIMLEPTGLIKKFSPMGKFLSTFQTASVEPNGLDVDRWGTIWVCDAAKHEVVRFSAAGSRLTQISAPPGPKPWIPTSVSVRSDGVVAIADAQNKLIHIYDWK